MENQIRRKTTQIINRLWRDGEPDKATLAALRNSTSILDQKAVTVWPILFSVMEERDLSNNGTPTIMERAVYAALHCYAVYQQGKRECAFAKAGKDENGDNLFSALARVNKNMSMERRVQAVLESTNIDSVLNSITHLVAILKGNNAQAKIDFARLAQDLYYFQISSTAARQVCLKWGQQYYFQIVKVEKENKK